MIPFGQGGPTSQTNLHPPCPRHHHLRHDGGWRISKTDDGTLTWTSPTGRSYATPPTTHPIDTTRGHPDEHTGEWPGGPPPHDDPPPF